MYEVVTCSDRWDRGLKQTHWVVMTFLLALSLGNTSQVWAKKTTGGARRSTSGSVANPNLVLVKIVPVDPDQKDSEISDPMNAFVLDQNTGKSYQGPTPFVVPLPAGGLFSITLRGPSTAAYYDGFQSNVQIVPSGGKEIPTIKVRVQRKSNRPNVSVVATGPVPTPNVPPPAVSAPGAPVSSLPAGKALVIVGIDSVTLAPMDQVRCIISEKAGNKDVEHEMECTQFFSPRGIQVNAGKSSFILKAPAYTVREDLSLESGQVQSLLLKLPGRLRLEAKQDKEVKGVNIQIDSGPTAENVSLPFLTDISSGLHRATVSKDGYSIFSAWTNVDAFTTTLLPVVLNADSKAQAFLCGLCAKTRGKYRLTTEFSIGPPEWFQLQFLLGIADLNKHLKLDLGVRVWSSGYLTVAGAILQAQFVTFESFALSARTFLGGGGGPNGALNKITWELGPLMSVDISKRVQFYLFPYFQLYSDVVPSNGQALPLGYRFILQAGFEFNLSRFVNLGLSAAWAPGTKRDMFSSANGQFLYPTSDDWAAGGLYFKISMILKWPAFKKKIQ